MALKYLYVPSGYKAGTAYGVLPNVANADLAFVRGSTATRINADDLIETMATSVPRLDYTDGSCPTLLTEPERINLAKYSEQITSWNKNPNDGTVTVRANEQISPDGEDTADVVSVLTQYDGVYTQSITSVTNTKYSCSAYVKHVSGSSKIRVGITSGFNSGTGSKYVSFDLSNGSTILNGLDGEADFKSVYVGNGWYRLIIENCTGYGSSSHFVVFSYEDGFTEFAVWGGQIEVGNYASSYIPNLSNGTTTRSADTGVISGDLSSYINSSEGVLEIRAKALFNGGTQVRISLSDRTDDNRLSLVWSSSANLMQFGIVANGGFVFDGGTIFLKDFTQKQTEMATFKIKWKSGDIEVKVDEAIVITETDTFSALSLNKLSLGKGYGGTSLSFEGNVQYIKVYDSATDF